MTDPPPIRSTISASPRGRGKLEMTYSNKQTGLELCDTFRGFPDEFVDFIVGGPQVRRILCHLLCELTESAIEARDKDRKAP